MFIVKFHCMNNWFK